MYFEYYKLLFLLLLPVFLVAYYIYLERSDKNPHMRVSTSVPWKRAGSKIKSVLRHVPFALKLIALILMILAIARPRTKDKSVEVDTTGIDIVLAMDVSTSMLGMDMQPNRFEASKDLATKFISQRTSDRMGLVVFAGESYTQCPLTTDRSTLISLVSEVEMMQIEDGTAIGNGLATAVARIRESDAKSKVVILITDGANNAGSVAPLTAAELAYKYGIKVYTIGVGKEGRVPYQKYDPFFGYTVQYAESDLDEGLLKEIAEITGGNYFRATDNTSLAQIYSEINEMEKIQISSSTVVAYEEKFQIFLLWAIIALLLSKILNWFVIRRLP